MRAIVLTWALVIVCACGDGRLPPTSPQAAADSQRLTRSAFPEMGVSSEARLCYLIPSNPNTIFCDVQADVVPAEPRLYQSALDPLIQLDPISITFSRPVFGITVSMIEGALSCSGTFGTIIGYDASDTEVFRLAMELVDRSDCGEDDVSGGQTGSTPLDLPLKRIVIEPPMPFTFRVFDVCCGHMTAVWVVTFYDLVDVSIEIAEVTTAGPDGSFTTIGAEREVQVRADVVPSELADRVTWRVLDADDDAVTSLPPDPAALAVGAEIAWRVPDQDARRWEAFDHPGTLDQKSLAFDVVASVLDDDGVEHVSEERTTRQDEIDTVREEYIELGLHRVPSRGQFSPEPRRDVGANTGDYGVMVFNNAFAAALNELFSVWSAQWQVNSIYRNPVHQRFHRIEGAVVNSWHQYHCAADLQTFPVRAIDPVTGERFFQSTADSIAAEAFWTDLAQVARNSSFSVESRRRSGVGHVHVERRCP